MNRLPRLALALAAALAASAVASPPRTEVLFQGFTWDAKVDGQEARWYRHLGSKAEALARLGVTHVWYPPVSRSVAPQGYLPGDWYDLGFPQGKHAGPTFYGTAAELKASLRAFKQRGIAPVADAVLNHRCASHREDGVWNVFHHASGGARWERWALAAGDYAGTGAPDTGADFHAAPDIDHENPRVRADIAAWLKWMRDEIGFEGLRFDFTKGYAPGFVREYARAFGEGLMVGEYWTSMGYDGGSLHPDQDGHRQQLADWVDGTQGEVSTFDFTTKGLLQEACRRGEYWRLRAADGRAAGFLGWWPGRAVTFVDNHDTGSTQAHWPFPEDKVIEGYAYILTHPGLPTVFYDHLFSWGPDLARRIAKLVRLRHQQGLHAESSLEILCAEQDLYAARIGGDTVMKLGARPFSPGEGWQLATSGPNYAVWTRQ